MTTFAHIAQKLFNRPLALHPDKAEVILAALADRLGIAEVVRLEGRDQRMPLTPHFLGEALDEQADGPKGYGVIAGAAIVPVYGTLVQRTAALRPVSGLTGYDGIRMNVLTALADPGVDAIVLDVDSPGGEVAGCFDLVDMIREADATKPVWAIVNEQACSAGYALASAARRVVLPRTGMVGSIGVIAMHVDMSRALAGAGLSVTLVAHGDRKADFADSAPLSREARDILQAAVDRSAALFNATVAANRGMSADAVDALQAACFDGEDAVAAGLADAVMPPDAALRALLATL